MALKILKQFDKFLIALAVIGLLHLNGYGQADYSEEFAYNHTGGTTSSPKYYGQTIEPKPKYYISKITFSNDGQSGCGWCYPDGGNLGATITTYGEKATIHKKCDGLPCKFKFTVFYKPYFIDSTIIKITKDPDENLSSTIWAENKSGSSLELVYKIEYYSPGTGNYITRLSSINIQAFSKIKVIPRFVRIDSQLYEQFLTPLYTRK